MLVLEEDASVCLHPAFLPRKMKTVDPRDERWFARGYGRCQSQASSPRPTLSPPSHHARSPSYLGNCNVHSVCGDLLQRLLLPSCPFSRPLLIRPPGSMPRTQRLWDRSSEFFGIYPSLTMVSSIYTLMSEYCPCPHTVRFSLLLRITCSLCCSRNILLLRRGASWPVLFR